MLLEKITEFQEVPFSPMEIVGNLRVGTDEERTLVEDFIREAVDGIETIAERAVMLTRWRLTIPSTPSGSDLLVGPLPFTDNHRYQHSGELESRFYRNNRFQHITVPGIELHMPPIRSIESVKYFDTDDVEQTWADTNYNFMKDEPGVVHPNRGISWPATSLRRDAMQIIFWAGETDRLDFTAANTSGQFQSRSGFNYQDGDALVLRASGLTNSALGNVATVPDGFESNRRYFVRDVSVTSSGPWSSSWSSAFSAPTGYETVTFNLAATPGGTAIAGADPATTGQEIDMLFAGQLQGVTRHALRKEVTGAYVSRCDECECNSGAGEGYFMEKPHLRKLLWRSAFIV